MGSKLASSTSPTSSISTGSRMDEVIFEEFKGTGNSSVVPALLPTLVLSPFWSVGTPGEPVLVSCPAMQFVDRVRFRHFTFQYA